MDITKLISWLIIYVANTHATTDEKELLVECLIQINEKANEKERGN